MSHRFATIRILLLQAREPDDPMKQAERRSFARRMGVDVEQILTHDLLAAPPRPADFGRHDAVMVGGSGDYYVSKGNLPRFDETLDAMRELVARRTPTFASCFGFQLLVEALGGTIVHDPEATEVGTYEIRLTDDAREDPLFGHLPDRFMAQMGRKDRADRLPDGALHLAASQRCPYHAIRIDDAPIWATQFHPELDRDDNLERFRRYMDGYAATMSLEEREAALQDFVESPETETLLPRFLQLVFGD
jgi:GMP synthase (glutamine-hydrolysing)